MFKKKALTIVILTSLNLLILYTNLFSQTSTDKIIMLNNEQYDIITNRMDIIPGMWRPMFESEQVAWISPPWESQEYIWFDFPEAIWEDGELLYLGHLSKRYPTRYPKEKSAPWLKIENGIRYEQVLPNGVSFGGEIVKLDENIAGLTLWIINGSTEELKDVKLQTCVYLDGIKEFNENSNGNKFVHIPNRGWMSLLEAEKMAQITEGFGVGWPSNAKQVSDLPVVVTKSQPEGHLLALTWFENTYSFIGNPDHPCMHADPFCDNLKPGEHQRIKGELIFFKGTINEFEEMFRDRM